MAVSAGQKIFGSKKKKLFRENLTTHNSNFTKFLCCCNLKNTMNADSNPSTARLKDEGSVDAGSCDITSEEYVEEDKKDIPPQVPIMVGVVEPDVEISEVRNDHLESNEHLKNFDEASLVEWTESRIQVPQDQVKQNEVSQDFSRENQNA